MTVNPSIMARFILYMPKKRGILAGGGQDTEDDMQKLRGLGLVVVLSRVHFDPTSHKASHKVLVVVLYLSSRLGRMFSARL